jgi:CubicO group peptidase (beta-lactamase class C family)
MPGMIVAIARHGKLAYMQCHGKLDVASETPLRPDSIMRIYSMSKPIVSVAAMILYERGAFQLDEHISRHLPEFTCDASQIHQVANGSNGVG